MHVLVMHGSEDIHTCDIVFDANRGIGFEIVFCVLKLGDFFLIPIFSVV